MPGDGSCLFHSLSYGLQAHGCQEDGLALRQRVARFIEMKPDMEVANTPLKQWVDWDSNASVAEYARKLAHGGLWGGAIEMAACAQLFSVDIAVYEQDTYKEVYTRISDFLTDGSPRGCVCLLYLGRAHYDAILPAGPNANAPVRDGLQQDPSYECALM